MLLSDARFVFHFLFRPALDSFDDLCQPFEADRCAENDLLHFAHAPAAAAGLGALGLRSPLSCNEGRLTYSALRIMRRVSYD